MQAGETVLGKWFSSWRKLGSLGALSGCCLLIFNASQLSLTIVLGNVGRSKTGF